MNDVISRQAAIDRLIEKFPYIDPMAIMWVVSDLPSVDAVPVIRCKDCRYSDWYTTHDGERRCYCMEHGSAGHTETDFCSYAERETDE